MKIVLINELYKMGGAEVQTLREITKLEEMGHQVYHITFDPDINSENSKNNKYYNIKPNEK